MSDLEIISFGCKLNLFETEMIRPAATNLVTTSSEKLVVFNSCAVTAEATRQLRQAIRKKRREKPDHKIIVTGCAAQTDPDSLAAMGEVDLILGNDDKFKQENWHLKKRVQVSDIMTARKTPPLKVNRLKGRARAFVPIQNGCDHRCTFCIIPYGRGNSRSMPSDQILSQIAHFVAHDHREIVLTGVDLTSWGADLEGTPKLGNLITQILTDIPNLQRLRLSSIDASEIDDTLFALFGTNNRLMPHLHLSLQAGDNMILKRMKRRHSREQAISLCNNLRKIRPDMIFGADLIAGFPTETDAMFENSLKLIDECALTYLHIFPFSPRPNTPAARMPQLHGDIIKERAARLRQKAQTRLSHFLNEQIATQQQVLMETENMGRTEHYAPVSFNENLIPGSIVNAHIIATTPTGLIAKSPQ